MKALKFNLVAGMLMLCISTQFIQAQTCSSCGSGMESKCKTGEQRGGTSCEDSMFDGIPVCLLNGDGDCYGDLEVRLGTPTEVKKCQPSGAFLKFCSWFRPEVVVLCKST